MSRVQRMSTCGRQPSEECQGMNGERKDSHGEKHRILESKQGEKGIYMGEHGT